jgi:hypothetical protein
MIRKYMSELKKLGYISIDGTGTLRKISIVKEIDF